MDVLTLVESRVRDGVRSRGIDPLSQPEAVRELVDAEVASILSEGSVAADDVTGDARALTQQAFSAIAGFGSLQQFLDDDTIEEIWINERLTGGRHEPGRAGPSAWRPSRL